MADALTVLAGDASILCGKSVPEFAGHPELQGRHCIRPAGHEGYHIAQRDDETHAQTVQRCLDEPPARCAICTGVIGIGGVEDLCADCAQADNEEGGRRDG